MGRSHLWPHGTPAKKPRTLDGVDLVIFDFDGVIADSEVLSLGTLQNALADHGLRLPLEEVRRLFLGSSLATISQFVAQNSPDGTATGFANTWQERLFDQFRAELKPIPMILPLLDWLTDQGIRYCVASSSSFERIGVALGAMGLENRFPDLFSAEQVENGKPAPDLFLLAAQRMGMEPAACLVIEDSPHGIQAAQAAGMRVFGFVDGAHLQDIQSVHERLLMDAGAELVLKGYAELLPAK